MPYSRLQCRELDVFKGVWSSGLNLYLELVIARNGRSSRTDQQTRLQHPPAIYKPPPLSVSFPFCWGMSALYASHSPLFLSSSCENSLGTVRMSSRLQRTLIKHCMRNLNQLDPLDVELKWGGSISLSRSRLPSFSLSRYAFRLFAFLNECNGTNGG